MDKYVKRSDSDRSRSVSGDSSCSSVSYRTSTPAPSASRTHTPQGTSDISLSDVELDSSQLFTQDIEESGTEQEDQRKRQEGTRQLKAMLWHLEKFFVFDSYVRTENDTLEGKSVHTGRARCQQKTCLSKGKAATYTYTTRSKVNLKKHYEKQEGLPKAREDELPAKRGGRQLCLEESFSRKDIVTPEVLRKTCTRSPHHQAFLQPPGAGVFRSVQEDPGQGNRPGFSATAKSDLFSMLYDTSYVATTADSWTVHNRAFIGMTCHWIGQDLRRQHGTLACKEIKEKQTNVVLAQAIFDVHHEFGLGNKVVATTTDNGANYVAAFKYFCNARTRNKQTNNDGKTLATHFGVGNMPVEEEEEQDPEVVVGQPANLHAQLEEVAPAVVKLPKHYRCGAHTLNLIATADVQSVAEWNQGLRAPFTKAAAKAQGTWNLQNRSSVVANSIKEKTGRKLKTYCSLMDVLSNPDKMRALNEILSKGGGDV
ncbi:hypothetical protein GWK47_041696 [Chionoecetes opilio]|uniref:Uncharacterized protein n=1 Tax=Chionoecetes opilio TaxID=41210 RepID=A0A8J4YIB4_CHIOP|nr:hypothetical protein GWK47_041696 [Chionoecetes opilio]